MLLCRCYIAASLHKTSVIIKTVLRVETDQTVLVRRTEIATEHDNQRFDLSLRFLDKLISAVARHTHWIRLLEVDATWVASKHAGGDHP